MDENAKVTGKNTKTSVTTNSVVGSNAAAATVAVSVGTKPTEASSGTGVSVAAGLALAINNLTQNTYVKRGASFDMTGNNGGLTVKGKSVTTGDAHLLGVSLGTAGAGGLAAAVSYVKPKINTTLGVEGSGEVSLGRLDYVNVLNDVRSSSEANMLSLTASFGTALSGNALLVFNDTKATAKAANASGTLDRMYINGDLGAKGKAILAAATAGTAAVGISAAYVDVNSSNKAILDTDNFTATISGNLKVSTNQDLSRNTEANATTVAGALGMSVAAGINAAIARNRAYSEA